MKTLIKNGSIKKKKRNKSLSGDLKLTDNQVKINLKEEASRIHREAVMHQRIGNA